MRLALFNHGGSYFNSIFILLQLKHLKDSCIGGNGTTRKQGEAQTRTRITIETITMIARRGGVDFLRFFPLSCFSAVYSSHILSDSIAMIVRRGGVDFVRFFLLSCFSAVYSSHILSDSIHNMVLLGENSIVDMDMDMDMGMGMSACLLLSCLKRVLICKNIYRLCGAALLHGISRLGSSCPFLLITFGVLPL